MSDKKLLSEELEEFLEEYNCFSSYYVDAVRALERENLILNVRLEAVQKQVAASEADAEKWRAAYQGEYVQQERQRVERVAALNEAAKYHALYDAVSARLDQVESMDPDRWHASEERSVLWRERDSWMDDCLEAQEELRQLKAAQVEQALKAPASAPVAETPSRPSSGTLGIPAESQKPVDKSRVPNAKKLPRFVRRSRAKS